MADSIEFFVMSESDISEEAYLNFRDRVQKMGSKNQANPKKMQRVKTAVAEQFGLEADAIDDILDEFNYGKVDASDPRTWVKFQNGKFDIGRSNLVDEALGIEAERKAYQKLVRSPGAVDPKVLADLEVVEGNVSHLHTSILGSSRNRS